MSDSADLHAVHRTLRGDTDAFAEIVERYTPVIYSLAVRMLGSAEDAEEATQEVFLRAYRTLGRFQLSRRFYPWLYTIALNVLRSERRRRFVRPSISATAYDDGLAPTAEIRARTASSSPEAVLLEREAALVMRRGLDALDARYREVFVLRQLEGLAVSDVAEILGIPEGTVKTRLFRARRRLARFVLEEGWGR